MRNKEEQQYALLDEQLVASSACNETGSVNFTGCACLMIIWLPLLVLTYAEDSSDQANRCDSQFWPSYYGLVEALSGLNVGLAGLLLGIAALGLLLRTNTGQGAAIAAVSIGALISFGLSLWLLIGFSWNKHSAAKLEHCSHAVVVYTEVVTYCIGLFPAFALCLCVVG